MKPRKTNHAKARLRSSTDERMVRLFSRSVLLGEVSNTTLAKFVLFSSTLTLTLFIAWAATTHLDEVSIAEGSVEPVDSIHMVQHLSGGLVDSLLVEEGELVKKGDVLLLFDRAQVEADIKLSATQLRSMRKRLRYLNQEFATRKTLVQEGLSSKLDFLKLKSAKSELMGNIEELVATQDRQKERLDALYLHAPVGGRIHNIRIAKRKAVIHPGQEILDIVPEDKGFVAHIEIEPDDIGHVETGQEVTLKFEAYDFTKYGGIQSKLDKISPSTFFREDRTPYYKGYVPISTPYIDDNPILIGMTLQAEVKTGKKTILQYLLKPIFSSARNALRER